jgi:hypothetical protein
MPVLTHLIRGVAFAASLLAMAVSTPAKAADPVVGEAVSADARFYLGAGYDDIRERASGSIGALLSWGSVPFGVRQNWRWRLGGMISADQDYWLGGGISYEQRLGASDWYYEAGFQPGIYSRGDAPAGEDSVTAPSFLSHVALGRILASGSDLSLVISHRSSGRIVSNQAISEEVMLRYARPF